MYLWIFTCTLCRISKRPMSLWMNRVSARSRISVSRRRMHSLREVMMRTLDPFKALFSGMIPLAHCKFDAGQFFLAFL